MIYLLDYGAGNVRSIVNAITHLGYEFSWITCPEDFSKADRIVFPGVGSFGAAITELDRLGYTEPLRKHILENKPFMGICVGMQCLFNSSEESPLAVGLGIIDAPIKQFNNSTKSVPHIGWNSALEMKPLGLINHAADSRYYFVHSYAAITDPESFASKGSQDWVYSLSRYHDEVFISSIQRGNVFATQFHPEKSGNAGLKVIEAFLACTSLPSVIKSLSYQIPADNLSHRIIACLDVRSNDDGDIVVTKGDQYDVREKADGAKVRNLGKPVELATLYYKEGADEITFLNITSFRDSPLKDAPMLEILRETSKNVFVPLTIGGGIRDTIEPDGRLIPALEVAGEYFRSGADKISIGSEAVYAAQAYLAGKTSLNPISEISRVYGKQAVVISVDPKRVYVNKMEDANGHHTFTTSRIGPNGETLCWYQCTVKGGRELCDLDVRQLVEACEALGAGEILLNCMDQDGTNSGYDLELIADVKAAVKIPVIASSGAGSAAHFRELFQNTSADAGLAAGIFHRREVSISEVKKLLSESKIEVRH